jgi:DNA-binding response OmpR family regulator
MQGSRGLELARHHRPDLIILDLNLPDLSGDQILSELKQDPTLQHIPVIMISGWGGAAELELSLSLGATAFLMKPFNMQEFVHTVEESLRTEKQWLL